MANFVGTAGDDTIDGSADGDTIIALGGQDTINAGGGSDTIVVGSGGSDTIDGGGGIDTLSLGGSFSDYELNLNSDGLVLTAGSAAENISDVEFITFDDRVARVVGAGGEADSLTDAVNAAGNGETLLVGAGDYSDEGRITIAEKVLEVYGAGVGDDGTVVDQFITTGSGGLTLSGVELLGLNGNGGDPAAGIKVLGTGGISVSDSTISATQTGGTNAAGIEVGYVSGDVTVDNVDFTGFNRGANESGISSYGIYFNTDAEVDRDISVTNSNFDLRNGGDDGSLRSYGLAFDGYGSGEGTLEVSGNTFTNMTWGMLFFDDAGVVDGTPDYSGIEGNTFDNTNEAVGNIRNLTDHVITTGANISQGVAYESFVVGTSDADFVSGTSGANLIAGNDGNDVLSGGAGADKIYGGAGGDELRGGSGADIMFGGDGADLYVVDNEGDLVVEGNDGGLDVVNTKLAAYALTDNVENLVYTGAKDFTGVGNALDNTIISGAGDDTLSGGAGADSLNGGTGNDTYVLSETGDTVTDSGGVDLVRSSAIDLDLRTFSGIENASLSGSADLSLTGDSGNNALTGNKGDNVILGGVGQDVLKGGDGDDTFVFARRSESTNGASDTIKDFKAGDLIDLHGIDANSSTAPNDDFDFIGSNAFSGVAGELRYDFVKGSGTLISGDMNGDGNADFTITLRGHVELVGGDFIL